MGLLDSVLGALSGQQPAGQQGGGLLEAVLGMVAGNGKAGGLGALVSQFQKGGLGEVIGSWVSTGKNLPISAEQLQSVLGSDTIAQLARQLGLSPQDTAGQLSQLMPQVVDQLTPDGQVPEQGVGSVSDLMGQLGRLMPR
jgi:uncharacterized protein YidB (DUF937 family)